MLAKEAVTIDHVSGGRVELGIGGAWYEREHNQYGIPFPPIGRRLAMMGEAAVIIKSLWTEERTTFDGRHYQLRDAICEPKPIQQPRIPLWIGGSGEGMMALTPAELVERLAPYVDRGVGDFLLMGRPPMDRRTLELFAGEVAPALRAS